MRSADLVDVTRIKNRSGLSLLIQIVIRIADGVGEWVDVLVVLAREVDETRERYRDFRVERAMNLGHVAKDLRGALRQIAPRRFESGIGSKRKLAEQHVNVFKVVENQPAFGS